MDGIGSYFSECDLNLGLEEGLNRDVNLLREALAGDTGTGDELSDYLDAEDVDSEECGSTFSISRYNHPYPLNLPCGVTTLGQLEDCLTQNVLLLAELQKLLDLVQRAIRDNRAKQSTLQSTRWLHPNRKGLSLISFRAKKWPYFVDYRMECLEIPEAFLDKLLRQREYHLYAARKVWSEYLEQKLKVSVKQRNTDVLSWAIRNRSHSILEQHEHLYFTDMSWDQIAYEEFNNKWNPEDCRLHYKNCLASDVNSGPWSKDEEKRLLGLVSKSDMRSWETVAAELGTHRTAFSCLKHYQQCLNPNTYQKFWTAEQDARLQIGVLIFGTSFWGLVANHVGARSGAQCLCRHYHKANDAKYRTGRWSKEEDKLLVEAVERFGDKGHVWQRISFFVSTRNSIQCRERWRNVHSSSNLLRPWTQEDDQKLVEIAANSLKQGRSICWSEIGKELNRRDDACLRRWRGCAPVEQQLAQKAHQMKKSLLRPPYVDISNRRKCSLRSEDIGEDLLSDQHKKNLEEYKNKVVARLAKKKKRRETSLESDVADKKWPENQSNGIRLCRRRSKRVRKSSPPRLGEPDAHLVGERKTNKRSRDNLTSWLVELENGVITDGKPSEHQADGPTSQLEEDSCNLITNEEGSEHLHVNPTSQLREPDSSVVPGNTRKDRVVSQTHKGFEGGMCSPEGLLHLQVLLNPFKMRGEMQFVPPYPHFPVPFQSFRFKQQESNVVPPGGWPHPLLLCRPPHEYPLYFI